MAKKIVEIENNRFGLIAIGLTLTDFEMYGPVKDIRYMMGSCSENYYQESYTLSFENSTKTLEVFDVNYVIRDEE